MIQMIVDFCACCLRPADECQNSPPVATYEVLYPQEEEVKKDAGST